MSDPIPRGPFDEGLFLAHFNKGREHFEAAHLEEAERELEEAYLLRPRDVRVLNLLGLVYFRQEKLDRAEAWFGRYGDWAVFLGRVTPVVRSFISIPAGVFRARFWHYSLLTAIGSAIWCFAFAGAGWAAGASWESFHEAFRYADYAVAATVIAAAAFVAWKLLQRRRNGRDAEPTQGYTGPSE